MLTVCSNGSQAVITAVVLCVGTYLLMVAATGRSNKSRSHELGERGWTRYIRVLGGCGKIELTRLCENDIRRSVSDAYSLFLLVTY